MYKFNYSNYLKEFILIYIQKALVIIIFDGLSIIYQLNSNFFHLLFLLFMLNTEQYFNLNIIKCVKVTIVHLCGS